MLKKIFYGLILMLSFKAVANDSFKEFSQDYKSVFGEEPAQVWDCKADSCNATCSGFGDSNTPTCGSADPKTPSCSTNT